MLCSPAMWACVTTLAINVFVCYIRKSVPPRRTRVKARPGNCEPRGRSSPPWRVRISNVRSKNDWPTWWYPLWRILSLCSVEEKRRWWSIVLDGRREQWGNACSVCAICQYKSRVAAFHLQLELHRIEPPYRWRCPYQRQLIAWYLLLVMFPCWWGIVLLLCRSFQNARISRTVTSVEIFQYR